MDDTGGYFPGYQDPSTSPDVTNATTPSGTVPEGYVWDPVSRTWVPPGTTPTASATTSDTSGNTGTGGTGGPPPTTGSINQFPVFDHKFNAPGPLDLGGVPGIPYIPNTPTFQPPAYNKPPAFSYADFHAPTYQEAASDPGYQFTLGQGEQALQQSAAARGLLNTGGTLKDILNYGQAAATTQYGNVFNRAQQTYGMNRGNALDTYNTNYGTQFVDPYKFAFQSAEAQFAPQMTGYQTQAAAGQHQNDLNNTNAYNTWLQDYNIYHNDELDKWNRMYQATTAQ